MIVEYFQIPKSPVHIKLSPSVNYLIQSQTEGGREKEREVKTDSGSRSICAALVFCAERSIRVLGFLPARAQVSLNDLYGRTPSTGHAHTSTRPLQLQTHNTFYERAKSMQLT